MYIAFAHATPVNNVTIGAYIGASWGFKIMVNHNPPGGDSQARPRRPRPELWVSAIIIVPSGASSSALFRAILLVDERVEK